MSCFHHYALEAGLESAFTVDTSRVTFGSGCLAELGARAKKLGLKRVALMTDAQVRQLPVFETATRALADLDVVVFDGVHIEPTDASFAEAIRFASEARVDGFVSLGGGSVIDTTKAANLYATHPASLLTYVNAPLGEARSVPGPLKPHIACPTTCGTGSEVTAIAIFDLLAAGVKTGIASPALRPTEALVDPDCTHTLPASVVAASGMDVLCHALESFTARPYTKRAVTADRPLSQGRNPWSDLGCREALSLFGEHFIAAVGGDHEARHHLMWAATLAGIAFGNAGVHIPHAMSYAVAGMAEGYVAHGVSVVLSAPSVFRAIAHVTPERHREAAELLRAPDGDVAAHLVRLMQAAQIPNGLHAVGFVADQVSALSKGAAAQRRLLDNAPIPVGETELAQFFSHAMEYW